LFNCFSNFLLELYMHVCRFQSIMFMFHNHLWRLSLSIKRSIIKRSEKNKTKALFNSKKEKKPIKSSIHMCKLVTRLCIPHLPLWCFVFKLISCYHLGTHFPPSSLWRNGKSISHLHHCDGNGRIKGI
jgi:hypothetical protein